MATSRVKYLGAVGTVTLFLFVVLSSSLANVARGDVFELANGGRVEGRLVQSGDGAEKTVVVELAAGGK
ncbi:MAG TPA: hypothetical protein VHK01_04235, partial [Lacipirellulaceae bacterium]|nr:hypothetical protein [Lacipirellulaceae bacterium]